MSSADDKNSKLAPWSEPSFNHLHSPYYTPSHLRLRDALATYLETHILPNALAWEADGTAPRAEALRWARSGFAFADIPTAYRPADLPQPADIPASELDAFHLLVSTDQSSRVPGGVMTSLAGASVIGAPPIIAHGTDAQKERWLPGLFTWETSFSLGITEPGAGSDVAGLRTTAVREGSVYVVNGYKKWITGTPWATHMTTAVRTGGAGMGGISILVIPLDSAGVSWKRIPNSGQNAGGASLITLDNVRVPVENLLGQENEGFKIIMTNFNRERFVLAVGSNRMARDCLSESLRYAHDRETFGKPLIANQIIRHKIATMARGVEAHWAWLEQIAYHVQKSTQGWNSTEVASRIALAKVTGGKLVEKASREAQQIFGGAGYQRGGVGAKIEQISRDLRMMVVGVSGGSEEILNDLAVRMELFNSTKKGWKL
ncbi:acyl-CoA dehydrogenase-like protein [Microthyrium microscopicum]|uniref:Acyl-CoA dehydrogenase-like protein n=1 Tax=Microthyrium microscopicum TaxID=703497 RepID=A0A6A6UL81_9PEZI|nr:acyl-CoA dehydrogenase-like protein [Microthyrium microscopicum]